MRAELARLLMRAARWVDDRPRPRRREWKSAGSSTLLARWTQQAFPIDVDIRAGLQALRARSREEWQNNDHAKAFGRLVKTHIVGPAGVRLQARTELRNGRPNDRANLAIERAWKDWGLKGSAEVTGRFSWNQACRTLAETVARDGEALFRHVLGWQGNAFGYAIELFDPESLDVTYSEVLPNGNRVIMGVELDGFRRPVAYWLLAEPKTPHAMLATSPRTRVPADELEHIYLPEWIWQTRGVPWISTALTRMHHLSGYEEAEVIAARGAAAKAGFYEVDPEASEDFPGDAEDEHGAPVDDARPGEFNVLPPGWRFQPYDPQHPTTAFEPFVAAMLRGMASGFGVSYATLTGDLTGANYSSLRHGALSERDLWATAQDWFVDDVCRAVYPRWLGAALMSGAITTPSGVTFNASQFREFLNVTWQPRRWAWVDPQKEIDADRQAHELRIKSLSAIIRDRGDDPEEVWTEIARDEQRMAELGVTPTPAPAAAPPASAPQDDDQVSDDQVEDDQDDDDQAEQNED